MGDGQRERCLVNGRERGEEEELKSQEASIRVSRLAEEPGEFWSSAAASLKPSVRVTMSVGGLGQAQNEAGGGSTRIGGGGGGGGGSSRSSSGGDSSGGVAAARDSRLRYGAQRASESWAGRAGGGRQQQQVETAAAGSAGFVPLVSQACAVPCVQGCATVPVSSLGLGSVGCWSWFTRRLGGGGTRRDEARRDEGRVDGALEGRGTRRDRVL
jgi:hypothetical protein